MEKMAHHAEPARLVDEIGFEPDQTTRRNQRLDADFLPVMIHAGDLRLAVGKILEYVAHGTFRNLEEKLLDRFQQVPIFVLAIDYLGARDEHFVTFASHLLNQDGDLHFAAATHVENVRGVGLRNAQSDVRPNLFHQAFPDMPRGNELPINAGQRTVVDRELHLDRGRIDRHKRERFAIHAVSDGFTDEDLLEPCDADDIPGMRLGNFDAFHPLEVVDRRDFRFPFASVPMNAHGWVPNLDLATDDFAESDSAQVI